MIAISLGVGVIGLVIGSFLNVVIYRVPLKESIVSPPSACPNCGHTIRGYDNIPVLSWLVLRGRCRDCHARISVRYPLVELGTAILFMIVALHFGPALLAAKTTPMVGSAVFALLAYLYLAAISVALALIDLDVRRLPNAIVLPSYLVGAVLLAAASVLGADYEALLRAVIGCGALGLAYLLMALVSPGGMGFGDVKLAGVLGLFLGWLGWGPLAVGAIAAFLLGGIFGIILILTRRGGRKTAIPFGPWMLAGAWVGILVGEPAWNAYLSSFGLV
ncbi:MAG TPA: prepilin peptidase [Lacisediminihabitans sp.]|nr:prepilin peptidase [Lacisediminihabitans sp.]HXD61012.1 prepilin peptidase [Lacisediminihabitans sp.]